MTPHQTALVTVLLERLKKINNSPNGPDAETLIRESTAGRPDAAYPPDRAGSGFELARRRESNCGTGKKLSGGESDAILTGRNKTG